MVDHTLAAIGAGSGYGREPERLDGGFRGDDDASIPGDDFVHLDTDTQPDLDQFVDTDAEPDHHSERDSKCYPERYRDPERDAAPDSDVHYNTDEGSHASLFAATTVAPLSRRCADRVARGVQVHRPSRLSIGS
jgi:hypothetical protein